MHSTSTEGTLSTCLYQSWVHVYFSPEYMSPYSSQPNDSYLLLSISPSFPQTKDNDQFGLQSWIKTWFQKHQAGSQSSKRRADHKKFYIMWVTSCCLNVCWFPSLTRTADYPKQSPYFSAPHFLWWHRRHADLQRLPADRLSPGVRSSQALEMYWVPFGCSSLLHVYPFLAACLETQQHD